MFVTRWHVANAMPLLSPKGDRRLATGVSPWNTCPATQSPRMGAADGNTTTMHVLQNRINARWDENSAWARVGTVLSESASELPALFRHYLNAIRDSHLFC